MGYRNVLASALVHQELEALFCEFSLTFASAATPVQVDVKPDIPQKVPRIVSPNCIGGFQFLEVCFWNGRFVFSLFSHLFNFILLCNSTPFVIEIPQFRGGLFRYLLIALQNPRSDDLE